MKTLIAGLFGLLKQAKSRLWIVGLLALVLLLPAVFVSAQDAVPTSVPKDAVEQTAGEIVDLTTQTAVETADTLQGFIDRLVQTPKSDFARVLLIIGGIILLAAGWRIYDIITLLAGFLIGALVALSLLNTDNTLITIAGILVGGLIGAALGYFVFMVAVALIGAYLGVVVANGIAFQLALSPINPIVLLIAAILGALVMVGLSFQFLILLSALVGAQMLTLGLGLTPIWTLIFAAIGIVLQLGLARAYNFDWRSRPRRAYYWRRRAAV
jgi:hypothetical protein